jgi:hypothetical protein
MLSRERWNAVLEEQRGDSEGNIYVRDLECDGSVTRFSDDTGSQSCNGHGTTSQNGAEHGESSG